MADLCKDLASDCISKAILGHAVTVKIKSHDFKIKTKVTQLCDYSNDEEVIHATAKRILLNMIDTSEDQPLALRLMGVRLSNNRSVMPLDVLGRTRATLNRSACHPSRKGRVNR